MDQDVPQDVAAFLERVDAFIAARIAPLQAADDNQRFFDHRREWARTDFEDQGKPHPSWEALLAEMRRLADEAGILRYTLPASVGGLDGTNFGIAVVREHLARRGLGLHNDLQNESSVVGNFPTVQLLLRFGSQQQKADLVEGLVDGSRGMAFALTEPDHGSDATWMETTAVRDEDGWVVNGHKRWITLAHSASHFLVFARTSGEHGAARGISAFVVPADTPGLDVSTYWWTFNMPTDHADVLLVDLRVRDEWLLGDEGEGLVVAQHFVHENRIRQAASSLGAAQYCIDQSVAYARERITFGQPLSQRQAIQWPLAELHTDAELLRTLIRKTASQLDGDRAGTQGHLELSDKVAMCNFRANRLVCEAADRAMQVHGGMGYSRHLPFEHIYRHHRRYRITEGSEEIQIRRVASRLFGIGSAPTGAGRPAPGVS